MAATREAVSALRTAEASEALYGKLSPGPGRPAAEVAAHQRARIHSAMIELVAERGYGAVTVRELARVAGVSSRAFYQHFSGKEECFLRTHELIVRRAAKRIVVSQAGERDWFEQLRLAFDAFARELEREPRAVLLALIEANAAGPAAQKQVRRAERTFEAMIAESFTRAPDGIVVPPIVIEGMVSGIAHVVRARTTAGPEEELHDLGPRLLEWALCYRSESAATLEGLESSPTLERSVAKYLPAPLNTEDGKEWARTGDDALILSAVAKLVAAEDYSYLSVPRIRAAAGVSRKSFDAHFADVKECFLAALEQRGGEAFTHAARAKDAGCSWASGVYLAIATLCSQVARDPVLAKLCFGDSLAPGPKGRTDCREHLMAFIVDLIRDRAPMDQHADELTVEASAGAIWGIIHHHVNGDRAHQLPQAASVLAFLALSPLMGPHAAVEAIRHERAGAAGP